MSKRFKYEEAIVKPAEIKPGGLELMSRAPQPLPEPAPPDVKRLRKEVKEMQAETHKARRGFKK